MGTNISPVSDGGSLVSDNSLDNFSLAGVQRFSLLSLQISESDVPHHQLIVVLHPTDGIAGLHTSRPPVQLLVNVSIVAVLQEEVTAEKEGQVRAKLGKLLLLFT